MPFKGWHGRGYLPHFDSPQCVQHVTFRTEGSLPAGLRLATQAQVDQALDHFDGGRILTGPCGAIVEQALLHFDGERYRVLAWCVMPNHVHVVIEQIDGFSLGAIVAGWKGHTSRRIAALRGRGGRVWATDYFDRYMRNERQLADTIIYVENNPAVAGLVVDPSDWPFSSARHRR